MTKLIEEAIISHIQEQVFITTDAVISNAVQDYLMWVEKAKNDRSAKIHELAWLSWWDKNRYKYLKT